MADDKQVDCCDNCKAGEACSHEEFGPEQVKAEAEYTHERWVKDVNAYFDTFATEHRHEEVEKFYKQIQR